MHAIWVIGKNTFREIIRDRILYGLLVFALILIGLSLAMGQLSFTEQARISVDFGFAAMNLSAIIIAIFVGSNLVTKEIEQRTVYTLLVRPLSRSQFLLGKVLGLAFVNIVVLLGLSIVLTAILFSIGQPWDMDCTFVVLGVLCESLVVLSVTLLFGAYSKPMLAVAFSIGVFLVGRSMDSLDFFAQKSESAFFIGFNYVLQRSLPNLSKFSWGNYPLIEDKVPLQPFLMSVIYGMGWMGVCITLTALILRKRDFT
ncbi:MAG: ABC transporter permease [Pseudomonadota bacterium]|nr:ABC transporter permease [Pseudomonadota bacterium]